MDSKISLIVGVLIVGIVVGFLVGMYYSAQEPTAIKLCRELHKPTNYFGTSTCEPSAIGTGGVCDDPNAINRITVNCG